MRGRLLVVRIALGTLLTVGLMGGCVTPGPVPALSAEDGASASSGQARRNVRVSRTRRPRSCKTCFVESKAVVDQYDKARGEYAKLKEEMAKLQEELDLTNGAINLAWEQLAEDEGTISPEAWERRAAGIEAAREEYRARRESYQKTMNDKEQALLNSAMEDIKRACRAVGRQVGAERVVLPDTIIQVKGDGVGSPSVDGHDLTAQVVAFLNAEIAQEQP